MTRLVLTRPHVHAGKTYTAGAVLDVDADIAEWLLANGIAVPEPKPARGDAETSLVQRKEPKS